MTALTGHSSTRGVRMMLWDSSPESSPSRPTTIGNGNIRCIIPTLAIWIREAWDVWTLTVQEYLKASRWKRFSYRLSRNPIVLFAVAPLALFLVLHRFPARDARNRERRWVHITNLAVLAVACMLAWAFGIKAYLLIQLIVLLVASTAGVWLFYVQHQFEDVYWERHPDWDFAEAALHGSSFYKLPKILQWFSGNIGFHHIHHLSPRIPNYRLEHAHRSEPLFQSVKPLTLGRSLKSLTFRLWDEARRQLVSFKIAKRNARQSQDCVPEDPESDAGKNDGQPHA